MIITAVEMAGGLALLVVEALILWGLLELGCRVFFWIKEKDSE
jgi:hypothetical protein